MPVPTDSEARVPRQVLENTEMRQTSLRGLLWVLQSDKAISFESEEPTELQGLHIDFYDGNEEVQSILTSRYGSIDPDKSILVAQDSVVVRTIEGDRLETEYLEWDPETERVRTDNPFILYRCRRR